MILKMLRILKMIKYEVEELNDKLIEEATPIMDIHRVELQSHDMRLNIDWESYLNAQDMDKVMFLVARDDENNDAIVGYSGYIISHNLHYKDYIYAIEDVFYVVDDKRGSRIAVNMVKMSEVILKKRGVDVITHHAKFTNNFAPFLERLGYSKTETMLAKRLTGE